MIGSIVLWSILWCLPWNSGRLAAVSGGGTSRDPASGGVARSDTTTFPTSPAGNDTVTIHERSGKTQTDRPVSISRAFRQGEIPNFAQASINGVPLLTQCDVKNRWPDGSVKFAIVSFVVPSLLAHKSVVVSFSNQTSGNNMGYLTSADMLGSDYDFDATVQMGGAKMQSVSARQMLQSGAFRYWLQGPVVTAVIIEDRAPSRTFDKDFGDGSKALHPIFETWFYPALKRAEVGYTVENVWASSSASKAMRDLTYSLTLTAGSRSPVTQFTHSAFKHIARSRWHKTSWTGGAPGAIRVDYNLAYLVSTGAIPNYDISIRVAGSLVSSLYAAWKGSPHSLDGSPAGIGNYGKSLSQAGASPWIGLAPTWDVVYLFTMSGEMREASLGNADLAGRIPWHFREADPQAGTGKFFDATGKGSVDTFGRVVSINARQTVTLGQLNYAPAGCGKGQFAADKINTGPISDDGWGFYDLGRTHMPEIAFAPYLMSGRYYYLEELQMLAAYMIAWRVGCADAPWQRQGNAGYFNDSETRGDAWSYRTVTYAAAFSPDGTPEKAYFEDKLRNNIAKDEGRHGVPLSIPSKEAHWDWGKKNQMWGTGASPLGIWDVDTDPDDMAPPVHKGGSVKYVTSPWMEHFVFSALGVARDLGYPTDNLLTFAAKNIFHQLLDPATVPYAIEAYRSPAILSTGDWIRNWGDVCKHMSCPKNWQVGQSIDGYGFIALGTTSFLYPYAVDGYTGKQAWDFIRAKKPEQWRFATEGPKWAIVPRTEPPPR